MFIPPKAMATSAAAILLLLAGPAVCFGQVGAGETQTWLDDTLQHKIEAKFRGMEGEFVKLETADGQVKKIPYNKLSLSSQLKVKKIADPKAFDAPPLPSSYSAPPVSESPFSPDDTIEQYWEKLTKQVNEGHADVAWHALPPSARADVEACIVRLADILGPNTFKQIQVVLPNLHTVVKDKRSFIVGSPSIAAQPEIAKLLNQILPAVEPLVGVLTKPATWNSENFKEGKVGPWLMLFANEALVAGKSLEKVLSGMMPGGVDFSMASVKMKVLEKTADTAKIEVTNAGKTVQAKYKKVDGTWISETDEIQFAQLATFKSYLENLDQAGRDEMKSRVRTGLTATNTILGALAKARTQQEFNGYFDSIAAQAVRVIQNGIATARQAAGGAGGAPNGSVPTGPPRKSISSGLSGVGGT